MSELSTRERIYEVLRHNGAFSKERMNLIEDAIGGAGYQNQQDHPSNYTVLCILTLLEYVEQLEARVEVLEKDSSSIGSASSGTDVRATVGYQG